MSNSAFTFERTSATLNSLDVFDAMSQEHARDAVRPFDAEDKRRKGSTTFIQDAIQSTRSLWALSTVTRLMMAREQCLRAAQQHNGHLYKIQELQTSLENVSTSGLSSQTKTVMRERILQQIERLQARKTA